jgi:O-antigen ligase
MVTARTGLLIGVGLLLFGCLLGNPGVTAATPAYTLLFGSILAGAASLLLFQSGLSAHTVPAVCTAALLLIWGSYSKQTTLDDFLSSVSLLNWFAFAGVVIATIVGLQNRKSWAALASAMVCMSVAICTYGLCIQGIHSPLKATFTNQDCFAVIPLIGLFLSLGLAVESKGRGRFVWLTCGAFLLSCVLLTGSRAAGFGVLVGHVAVALLLYVRLRHSANSLAVALAPAALGMLTLLALAGTNTKLQRWEALASGRDKIGIQSRVNVLSYGWQTFQERPLSGFGPGTFHLAYQKYRPELLDDEEYMNVAHNDYMQVLVELGVPGIALWVGLLGFAAYMAWRCDPYPAGWCAGSLGGLTAVYVYSAFNFAVPVTATLLWVGALLGLACYLPPTTATREAVASKPGRVIALLLIAAALPALQYSYRLAQQQRLAQQAEQLVKEINWDAAYAKYEQATLLVPGNIPLLMQQAEICKQAYHFSGDTNWLKNWGETLKAAQNSSPRSLPASLAYANYLEYIERHQDARKVLETAVDNASYNPFLRRALVRNDIYVGNFDAALHRIRKIRFARNPTDDRAQAELVLLMEKNAPGKGYELLRQWATESAQEQRVAFLAAEIAAKRGQRSIALSILQSLVRVAPANATYVFELAELEGEMGLKQQQLTHLDVLKKLPIEGPNAGIVRQAWQAWARLSVQQGEQAEVERQLQTLLVSAPEERWARSLLAQSYDKRGAKAEARGVLRDGINYDADGQIRLELAELCMRHGHPEVAKGYYEELVAASKDNPEVRRRLREANRAAALQESNGSQPGLPIMP